MKKLLGIMALSAIAASAFAQGTVSLQNQTGLVKQWTSSSDATPISVAKNGGYVQLIAASAGTALANPFFTGAGALTANYSSLSGFLAANPGWAAARNGANLASPAAIALAAGTFGAGTYTITGIGLAAPASYIVLGWTGAYSSIDLAIEAQSTSVFMGQSAIFNTVTSDPAGSPPPTPGNLRLTYGGQTLAPLNLVVVPEPSTFALAGLGLASLLIFRRRK